MSMADEKETIPDVKDPMIGESEHPRKLTRTVVTNLVPKVNTFLHLGGDDKSSSRTSSVIECIPEQPCLIRIKFLFCIINTILLIAIGTVAYFVSKEWYRTVERQSSQLCVDCDSIRLHPDDKVDNISRYEDICCANKSENVGTMVSYFTQHWVKMKMAKEDKSYAYCEDIQRPKPVLKLVGVTETQPDNRYHRVLWSSQYVVSQDNISYDDKHGEIQIKKSGFYHVYSQIVFRLNKTSTGTLLHKVMRANEGYGNGHFYEETVFQSTETPCVHESAVHYHSSYQRSVAQLQDGDRLHVKVHSGDDIHSDPHLHWFGVHLV